MIALFFDTETTGFPSPDFTPEIVQVGAILQDTETKRVYSELNLVVRPNEPIPEEVSKIHGITSEIALVFGINKDVADNMFALLAAKAEVLVAHNIAFDVDIVNGAWEISRGIVADKEQVCTMRSLIEVMKLPRNGNAFHNSFSSQYKAPKLIEAYRHYFGKDFDGAHDAMADVRACRDVYFAMIEAVNA